MLVVILSHHQTSVMIFTCSVKDLLRTNLSLELKLHLFLIFFHLLASPVLGGDMMTTGGSLPLSLSLSPSLSLSLKYVKCQQCQL